MDEYLCQQTEAESKEQRLDLICSRAELKGVVSLEPHLQSLDPPAWRIGVPGFGR